MVEVRGLEERLGFAHVGAATAQIEEQVIQRGARRERELVDGEKSLPDRLVRVPRLHLAVDLRVIRGAPGDDAGRGSARG